MGDFALKWDKSHEDHKDKGKYNKFQSFWIKSYTAQEKLGHHIYRLQSLDRDIDSLLVNGQDLNQYFQ